MTNKTKLTIAGILIGVSLGGVYAVKTAEFGRTKQKLYLSRENPEKF